MPIAKTAQRGKTTDGHPLHALIVNADDFGLTAGVNAGIIGAHRRGPVRTASLMVTAPGFADAVLLAREHQALDLGIHLTLSGGVRPLLPPTRIPSLLNRDGRFPSRASWLIRALAGRLRADELRAELRAQFERALATNLPFSHVNGHHHTHLFAPVAAIASELAKEYGIRIVRRAVAFRSPTTRRELLRGRAIPTGARAFPPSWRTANNGLRAALVRAADQHWGCAYADFMRTVAFEGFAFPTTIAAWRRLLHALPVGVTEMMCHPGLVDDTLCSLDSYLIERETELRWLGDERVHALFAEAGVSVTSFNEARDRDWLVGGRPERR